MRKLLPLLFVLLAFGAVACQSEVVGLQPEDTGQTAVSPAEGEAVAPAPSAPAPSAPAPAAGPAGPAPSTSAPAPEAPAPPVSESPAGPGGYSSDGGPAATQEPQASSAPGMVGPSGGVLRRLWSDPPTLDPHLTGDTTSAFLVVEIFGGLLAFDTDLNLVPDLAESYNISSDGVVYTFKLRPNAKFHNGKPVTAQDFKYSFERAANPDTGSPTADTYLSDIVGVADVLEGRATEITGVKVIDELTLQITIDSPKAYFLAKMTYPTSFVVDRENVENGGPAWTDNPNGTGPFRLKEYRIGERMVLERNDAYHRELANLDRIDMNLAGGQAMAMYENDEIDITRVGLFDLERVLDPNEPLNKELVVAPPDFNITYIGFSNEPPFDDPKFRQALNHAIDKELIATEVLSDLVIPAYGILPPGFPGYNPDLQGLRYDPELAVQLLSESKYADPESRDRIEITVPGTGGTIGLDLEVIIEMWRQTLGVEVEIQQMEWASYLERLNRGDLQAYAGLGWEADYPDPQDFLDILFHSESSINHGGYANLALDAILEEGRTEQDVTRRIELYQQAEEMIVNDAAWVPLWYRGERFVLIKPHIKDYRLTPMILPKLRHVYFEG